MLAYNAKILLILESRFARKSAQDKPLCTRAQNKNKQTPPLPKKKWTNQKWKHKEIVMLALIVRRVNRVALKLQCCPW